MMEIRYERSQDKATHIKQYRAVRGICCISHDNFDLGGVLRIWIFSDELRYLRCTG